MGNRVKKILSSENFKLSLNDFYLKLKNVIMFLTRSLFFNNLQMVLFTMFFRRCLTLRKLT